MAEIIQFVLVLSAGGGTNYSARSFPRIAQVSFNYGEVKMPCPQNSSDCSNNIPVGSLT